MSERSTSSMRRGAPRKGILAGGLALALLPTMMVTMPAFAAPAEDAAPASFTAAGDAAVVVPDGVCAVNVTVAGAPGGVAVSDGEIDDPENPGEMRGAAGAGATITTRLNVGAGDLLDLTVGSAGGNGGGAGIPGGGIGGGGGHPGGGGGGYSSITLDGNLLLLAGGGGGTGGGHTSDFGQGGDAGSDLDASAPVTDGLAFSGNNGLNGQDSGWNADPITDPGAGEGGSISAGGAGGINPQSVTDPEAPGHDWNGFPGSSLQGGNGGVDIGLDTGGAGGGGYFGGGGGAATSGDVGGAAAYFVGGGGGGGSSFVSDLAPVDQGALALSTNRDGEGAAQTAYAEFEWIMCDYDLSVAKSVVGAPVYEDGDTVRYSVTVTNEGADNMAIGDTVSLVDDLAEGGTLISVDGLGASTPAAGETITAAGIEAYDVVDVRGTDMNQGLAAGASATFVYDIVVNGDEPVENTVTVSDRTEDDTNDTASAVIDPARPSLNLVKSSDTEVVTEVGQVVTYTFAVTNTGNIEMRDIAITEGEFSGHGAMSDPVCPTEPVLPDETIECTAEYEAVAQDLTGDPLTNTATASGVTPGGTAVVSNVSDVEIPTEAPAVVKAAGLATTGSDDAAPLWIGALVLLTLGAATIVASRVRATKVK